MTKCSYEASRHDHVKKAFFAESSKRFTKYIVIAEEDTKRELPAYSVHMNEKKP